ncbi:hypothetical protein Poli38472_007613 [Pythium oligandrum]|uniref:CUE domain-containing protein n=1 Tax=Pythium oligandrum TaxID=41045 RepID=A0A8K1CQG6_PYTOL|nr:hypothetical protein Poli38472_007613 [Pythium oligandrum]|eukprot:TMW67941.1 hypothetical protein Poli38472_007613 [Pythium oligandrum]
MDTLQSVFPSVPRAALQRVLEICDQSVEAASSWLIENDWHELVDDEEDEQQAQEEVREVDNQRAVNGDQRQRPTVAQTLPSANAAFVGTTVISTSAIAATYGNSNGTPTAPMASMALNSTSTARFGMNGREGHHGLFETARRSNGATRFHHDLDGDDVESEDAEDDDEDEEEDDDDEDDDDDDGDANSYYDSGDEAYYHNSVPHLTKRIKVTQDDKPRDAKSECFWASFDDQTMSKTLIELLNTTLSKVAHSKVTLLNKTSAHLDEEEATIRLKSILVRAEEESRPQLDESRNSNPNLGNSLRRILNSSPSSPVNGADSPTIVAGQKRKRTEDESSPIETLGFFAYFFPITDLDMIWRSIMHAHLFSRRFGELIEFHTSGCFNRRDFDEMMHIHTTVSSSSSRAASIGAPLSGLKCCVLIPCEASDAEIFRVGKNVHTTLKLPGSLYYRALDVSDKSSSGRERALPDLLSEDGILTEDSFRRFARYRIKKEEADANTKTAKDSASSDHFLGYQRQHRVEHCLQALENNAWTNRLSG